MTRGGSGTIWSVHSPAATDDLSPGGPVLDHRALSWRALSWRALSNRALSHRALSRGLLITVLVVVGIVGTSEIAASQGTGDPPVTVEPDPTTIPPDPEPTVPPGPDPTVPPDPEPTVPPSTTTTFVPAPTVAPTTPTTFQPTTTTTLAPPTTTTEPTDSSVVADDRTVVDPAPGVVAPSDDAGDDADDEFGPGWWTAGTRLRMAVAGLGGLAMVVSVLTLLYWRHTKPDLTMGGTDTDAGDRD